MVGESPEKRYLCFLSDGQARRVREALLLRVRAGLADPAAPERDGLHPEGLLEPRAPLHAFPRLTARCIFVLFLKCVSLDSRYENDVFSSGSQRKSPKTQNVAQKPSTNCMLLPQLVISVQPQ